MKIASAAKIEFIRGGSVAVLLDIDGDMTEPLSLLSSQDIFEAEGVLASDVLFRALGGATARLRFAEETTKAGHSELESEFLLVGESDLPLGDSGTLRVSLANGDKWEFTPAVAITPTPSLPFAPDSRLETRWEFLVPARPTYTAAP